MAKLPDYDTMTFEQLNEIAGEMRARQVLLGDALKADMPALERLPLEIERNEIRAHQNVIQPLRVKFLVAENDAKNPENIRLAGMSDEEFEAHVAKLRDLRQAVAVSPGPDGTVYEPAS